MDSERLGLMIRFHRKKARLSQKHLALLSGLGKTVVFDVERGKSTVQLDTILKIMNVLNIQMEFHSPLMPLFKEQISEKS